MLAGFQAGAQGSKSGEVPFPFATSQLAYPDWARKSRSADVRYCEALMHDLKAGRDIRFLRPVYEAEMLDELQRAQQFGKCDASHFVKSVAFEPRIWESIKHLPQAEQENYGTKWLMSKRFLLYRVDIDRDPKNGLELVLYGGGAYSDKGQKADFTYFVVPRLDTCEPKYRAQVYDVVNHPEATVGVLEHRSQALIYETRYYRNQGEHSLRLQRVLYADKRKDFLFATVCTFVAKP